MIAVSEMTSFDELANLRVTWKQLWENTRDASFVQSWEWLRSYWRMFGDGMKLRTLVVSLAAKPIGIVPFVLRPVKTKLGTANVLTWPHEDWGVCYGQIGPNPAAALSAAIRYISRSRDWNAMELSGIDEQGLDRGRTRNALKNCGIRAEQTDSLEHPVVQLEGSWDWYMEEQGLESRVALARAERQIECHGPVSFHRWRPVGGRNGETERRWDLFRAFEMIRRASTADSSKADAELAFLKDVHPVAVDAGAIDICTLTVNGHPVACSYGYATHGSVEVSFTGAFEQAGEAAVTTLIGHMIRDSFMRGDQRIIFRHNDEPIVAPWTNTTLKTVTLSHVPKLSPRGQLLKLGRGTSRLAPTPTATVQSASAQPAGGTNKTAAALGIYAGS